MNAISISLFFFAFLLGDCLLESLFGGEHDFLDCFGSRRNFLSRFDGLCNIGGSDFSRAAERFALLAFDDRVGDYGREQLNGTDCVVVAGNDIVDEVGVAVGVDDGDDGDTEFARFAHGVLFPLEIDDEEKTVKVDGEYVTVTPTEFGILRLLTENAGKVFSMEQIYENVWNEPAYNPENTVAVHIRRIREKIEINPKNPKYLKVVWGIGYKIEKL